MVTLDGYFLKPNILSMKKFYLSLLLSFIIHHGFSQIGDSRTMIDTTYRPALYFQSGMDEDDTKNAIESYFDSLNIEKEKGKGFILKKIIRLPSVQKG